MAEHVLSPSPVVIPVTGGTFECPWCYARWVGTWRGDPALMVCIRCERPMTREDDDEHG